MLKKQQLLSWWTFLKKKKLAVSNRAASLATIAPCAVRAGSSRRSLRSNGKGRPCKAAFVFGLARSHLVGAGLGLKLFESIFGTVVAPSSALKYGSSLKPNSFAEMTVGNFARVVL